MPLHIGTIWWSTLLLLLFQLQLLTQAHRDIARGIAAGITAVLGNIVSRRLNPSLALSFSSALASLQGQVSCSLVRPGVADETKTLDRL